MNHPSIVLEGYRNLHYEIREIVDYGHALQRMGRPITWENIGDPVAAGEKVEPWIKEIVADLASNNEASFAYCPSRGVLSTREYLAAEASAREGGTKLGPDDILFLNGIADGVDKVYDLMKKDARVLMPSPSYPTHTSNEGKRGDYPHLQFQLDPEKGWLPDLEEIENKVKYNPQVVAIMIVNPDNPTGAVYPEQTLRGIVEIARRYGLFVICDETYANIVFNGASTKLLSQVVGDDVPGLALRSMSKDVPWPGSRCGWIEMLNRKVSPAFSEYCDALVKSKMMEVCSTTLPQLALPLIYGDKRFAALKERRAKMFEARANQVYEYFRTVPGVIARPVCGALYYSVTFRDGVLRPDAVLPVEDPRIRAFVEKRCEGVALDKRFVQYMMASEGVCVTPLTGFHTELNGFRITLLNPDDAARTKTMERIGASIRRYIGA
ncbi:MAG: pyridoxal phosphate-dependent aminotransferase [Kiritimatiellae bacterium]|nr:pyridoxal phosphate-dependent aminotransferase [Kiritimatiellia bacterium]